MRRDPLTINPHDMVTLTLSKGDLDMAREALLLMLQKTRPSYKGKPKWLAVNAAYDNLVDAYRKAEEAAHEKA